MVQPLLSDRIVTRKEQVIFGGVLAFLLVALAYGSIQITQTSAFLHMHASYVRARDTELQKEREVVTTKMNELQQAILTNQGIIIDHIKLEEKLWARPGKQP